MPLRFVLDSTADISGQLVLSINGRLVNLNPDSDTMGLPVNLRPGTNVYTVSMPLENHGLHEFEATFIPDEASQDNITENNRATAVTNVMGPGHILVVDADGRSAAPLLQILSQTDIETRYTAAETFPQSLAQLINTDLIILVDTPNTAFSYHQQEMILQYVTDLGGGLIMTGGPDAFGAGGWIGSDLAEIIPVDMDPPQRREMPQGALALIMHACEMPQGNYWGKTVAIAAVESLSRLDYVGVLDYSWQGGDSHWVHPLSLAGDKIAVTDAIQKMTMGDMPDFGPPLQAACNALSTCPASQRHVIIISDGDPQMPSQRLLDQLVQANITVTGVAVFPHSQADTQSLQRIAEATDGRFYNVNNASNLPQIFIKEAQIVRRPLIIEQDVAPRITYALNEAVAGLNSLPMLTGYVLTAPKGGLNQLVIATDEGDPILATCQAGLGRVAAFTSSVDSRWAASWLQWTGNPLFWEQLARSTGKPTTNQDCEIFTDVQGRDVALTLDAVDEQGRFVQFAHTVGQVIAPDMTTQPLSLTQVGPGQYRADFQASQPGNYVVNITYQSTDSDSTQTAQSIVTVPYAPEFRELSDNAPLLAQVSEITKGRILPSDPTQADLFNSAGLNFPEVQWPQTQPLLIIWTALFLLDIAVRRIAIDFIAVGRKIIQRVKHLRAAPKADASIERLKLSRDQARQQIDAKAHSVQKKSPQAAQRYQPSVSDTDTTAQMPLSPSAPPPASRPAASDTKPAASKDDEKDDHINRLLRARRQARKDTDENN